VHRTTRAVILSAVAIAAALGLGGCSDGEDVNGPELSLRTLPPTTVSTEAAAPTAPLPPPTALTDVLSRIADAGVPGTDKLNLVESATSDDAAAMDKFGRALAESGYAPVTFEAKDLRWALDGPGKVSASVTIKPANASADDFRFPMEFNFANDTWQLTRRTADVLLHIGEDPVPAPTPTPPP